MSQPEQITLTYDPGTGSVTKTYDRFDPQSGYTIYNEENASLVSRDELRLYRTLPKRNGAFLGMAKASAKITIDVPATDAEGNSVIAPIIIGFNSSIYPSVDLALVADAIYRMADFIVSEQGLNLSKKLEI